MRAKRLLLLVAVTTSAVVGACAAAEDSPSSDGQTASTGAAGGNGGAGGAGGSGASGGLGFGGGTICSGGQKTTISGTAYAPNGTLPLYNVIAYVPSKPVDPFPPGVVCDQCGVIASGAPVAAALSDEKGHFVVEGVPSGKDVPLVLQLGKWRRQIVVPEVLPCVDTPLSDPQQTRLPRNQGEGDMPRIAVTTGGCDKVACMLPKVGIDPAEFGASGQGKAVSFYTARNAPGPPGMLDAKVLWNDVAELEKYDMAIFSCECDEAYGPMWNPQTKDDASIAAVAQYLDAGGRIFTTDFQYTWYKYSPDPAMSSIGEMEYTVLESADPVTFDGSFPKGKALLDWLKYVDPAAISASNQVQFDSVFYHVHSMDPAVTQTWATTPYPPSGDIYPNVFTVNTPAGKPVDEQCGKGVHLDVHVNGTDKIDTSFPAGCASALKPGEEVFAFLFFDLASCIQDDGEEPEPPK